MSGNEIEAKLNEILARIVEISEKINRMCGE